MTNNSASASRVSEVSICNLALGWLGQTPITDLNDNNDKAELCKINYPLLRNAVLEEQAWTFATVRFLSESQTRDDFDGTFKHALPNNTLRVIRVFKKGAVGSGTRYRNPVNSGDQVEWVRMGSDIYARASAVTVLALVQVEDVTKFSAMFCQALAARIAADLAIPLTHDATLQATMWQLYERKLAEAAYKDGSQGRNEIMSAGALIRARSGG